MESGDRLNIAFVETTLDESMMAEVDDLDTTVVDEETRKAFRCSTPVNEMDGENRGQIPFDVSCNADMVEDPKVTQICDAMAEVNVKSE